MAEQIPSPRRVWSGLIGANLRFALADGFRLSGAERLTAPAAVPGDFFGVCVATQDDPACDDYVLDRLRELGLRHVRLDYAPSATGGPPERLLRRLLDDGFAVCLHLVPPPAGTPRPAWRAFVAQTLDAYGARAELVEIGATANRRRWSGLPLADFLARWGDAHELAAARGIPVAAPNVTDFEPFYNVGLLAWARATGRLPAVHSNNLFAERAGEPERFDPKILGPRRAAWLKYNTVKKAALLRRITAHYGVPRLMSMHTAWSARRLRRRFADPWPKQADYLQRFLLLTAASGALDRVYWGPLIGGREGLVDDGTDEYPAIPRVTCYDRAPGRVADYRIRPAFAALRQTVRKIAGARFLRDCAADRHDQKWLEFAAPDRVIHAVWRTDDAPAARLAEYLPADRLAAARVSDRDGRPLSAAPEFLDPSPVFLEWPSA